VLLDELTASQNLAMTLTLDIDPLPPDVRRSVERIAAEAGLGAAVLDRKVATLQPPEKLRVRLGRAIALDPVVLLLEHPTATLAPPDVPAFAEVVARLANARSLSVLAVTADERFASAIAQEAWGWRAADGSVSPLAAGTWSRVKRLFGA
jgi:ABC-type lipoprotein export system ATPase subunit